MPGRELHISGANPLSIIYPEKTVKDRNNCLTRSLELTGVDRIGSFEYSYYLHFMGIKAT